MEELNFNFLFESSKKDCMVMDMENLMMPGLMELFHISKEKFAEMILNSENDINTYQFVLNIKNVKND